MFRKVCRYAKEIYLCRVNEAQNNLKNAMKTTKTLTIAEEKANYVLAVCKQKNRSLQYCLDYAIWVSQNDEEMIQIQNAIKESYK